eukprot:TRINITY_DN12319_c0_g1_i11.p4 TRINITY_DN12319_c0_g1~~TRINITY_DN12319_c0_g1_i11.p4  ORF type:complete len:117 (+),score=43.18 TRINITY_DN12319_c0_g1_i11:82-432(+)
MQTLGIDAKSPVVFDMIAEMDRPSFQGGVSFEQFLQVVAQRLGDQRTREGIDRIFDLFDTDRTESISFGNLKRVTKELGDVLNDEEIRDVLTRSGSNSAELSRDDFFNIMTKKTFG